MKSEEKEYKGYNLFSHIRQPRLRAWNRCAMLVNTRRDGGEALTKGYVAELDDIGREHLSQLLSEIKKKGYETVKKEILKELNS